MKKEYELTDKAGEFVAGRRIVGDNRKKPLVLSDKEAAYEVQIAAVRLRKAEEVQTPPSPKSKTEK